MIYRLALDATAVKAFAAGSIHVGEVLTEIADEHDHPNPGALVAVPVAALVAAHRAGADMGRLNILVALPCVTVTTMLPSLWRQTAAAAYLLDGLDRACAALLVVNRYAGYVLTADPDVYGGIETVAI